MGVDASMGVELTQSRPGCERSRHRSAMHRQYQCRRPCSARDLQRLGAAEKLPRWSWSVRQAGQRDKLARIAKPSPPLRVKRLLSRGSDAAWAASADPALSLPAGAADAPYGGSSGARTWHGCSDRGCGVGNSRGATWANHGAGAAIARGVEYPGGGPVPAIAHGNPSCRCMAHLAGNSSLRCA